MRSKEHKLYAIPEYTTAEGIKAARKSLGMNQREFAEFVKVSTPTVERWEGSSDKITGPIVVLVALIMRDAELAQRLEIPDRKLKVRLYYMYEDMICTVIDADEVARVVEIYNYTDNLMKRAFGVNNKPSFEDYEEFLESRCFPKTRDKLKIELESLDIPYYDPMLIISKTEGRMANDKFWIKIIK